jgi:pimeloyl-ACP methyl ester carboxylesterase
MRELTLARQGISLLDGRSKVRYPMEALYVAGHSLGGAMAQLFALKVLANRAQRTIAERLRAVYTFGQPMAVGAPPPGLTDGLQQKLFRHVLPRDPVPALPPAGWGPFVHLGREYRHENGAWQRAAVPVAQMAGLKEIPRSLLAFLAPEGRRAGFRYSVEAHGPQHYITALHPGDRVSEFGD